MGNSTDCPSNSDAYRSGDTSTLGLLFGDGCTHSAVTPMKLKQRIQLVSLSTVLPTQKKLAVEQPSHVTVDVDSTESQCRQEAEPP